VGSTPTPGHLSGRPDQNSLWKTLRGGSKDEKPRVPDTFQLGAILSYTAFLAFRKINKLRVFTEARRFGIVVPPISEATNDWVEFGPEGYWILNTDTQIRLRKEVREEQWAHNDEWRKWATLALAILGFTLGFWSLYVKSKQPDPCQRNSLLSKLAENTVGNHKNTA
jgi:hypothetical protein